MQGGRLGATPGRQATRQKALPGLRTQPHPPHPKAEDRAPPRLPPTRVQALNTGPTLHTGLSLDCTEVLLEQVDNATPGDLGSPERETPENTRSGREVARSQDSSRLSPLGYSLPRRRGV